MPKSGRLAVCHPEFLEDLQHWVEVDRRTAKRLLDHPWIAASVARRARSGLTAGPSLSTAAGAATASNAAAAAAAGVWRWI